MSKTSHTFFREYTNEDKSQDDIISKLREKCIEISSEKKFEGELENAVFLYHGEGFLSKVIVSSEWLSLNSERYMRRVNVETIPWGAHVPNNLVDLLEDSEYEIKED